MEKNWFEKITAGLKKTPTITISQFISKDDGVSGFNMKVDGMNDMVVLQSMFAGLQIIVDRNLKKHAECRAEGCPLWDVSSEIEKALKAIDTSKFVEVIKIEEHK